MSLLGLVRHMADVERRPVPGVMAGRTRRRTSPPTATPTETSMVQCPIERSSRRRGTFGGPRRRSRIGSWPGPRISTSPATATGNGRSHCARCRCTWWRSASGTAGRSTARTDRWQGGPVALDPGVQPSRAAPRPRGPAMPRAARIAMSSPARASSDVLGRGPVEPLLVAVEVAAATREASRSGAFGPASVIVGRCAAPGRSFDPEPTQAPRHLVGGCARSTAPFRRLRAPRARDRTCDRRLACVFASEV
jgi:hypothetical protein